MCLYLDLPELKAGPTLLGVAVVIKDPASSPKHMSSRIGMILATVQITTLSYKSRTVQIP